MIIEPDVATWDAFTQCHSAGHLLQSSAWAALKRQVGWGVRRVGLAGPQGLLAGAQILIRRRFGLSVAYIPRGPLFSGDPASDDRLLAELDRLARRNLAVFLRIEPNVLQNDPAAAMIGERLRRYGFREAPTIQPSSTIHLALSAQPEELLAVMSKGHRADIRRATREGVTVRIGEGPEDLDRFYTIMEQTGVRAGFAIHSRDYYHSAWKLFGAQDDSRLLLAERAGQVVAAFLVFAWAGEGLYLYGGSTDEGLKSGANHALQWQALQWARERGCTHYDFWGIPDLLGQAEFAADATERVALETAAQVDPLYGVFRFKKGFGGHVTRYLPAFDLVYIPPLYSLWLRRFGG